MRETGFYQQLGDIKYFIPYSLPPKDPDLQLTPEIITLLSEASFALGQLNEMGGRLPNLQRFIKAYVIKEALISSEIEGIHTTLMEVFTAPLTDTKPSKETQLVLNYKNALDEALSLIKDQNYPLVSRVILKAHETLMMTGDGDKSAPGSYRQQSVRVGNLIPPPAPEIPNLIKQLEDYMNSPSDIPPLIRIGLVHVHFETIHPFLDGNGRIGRLLIVLMLIFYEILDVEILYPSFYFKKFHLQYYQCLDRVRTHGDYEGWIAFYLSAIRDSAQDAHKRAKQVELLESQIRLTISESPNFSRIREISQDVIEHFFATPVTTISDLAQRTGGAYNTISNVITKLINENIIQEDTASKRNKTFHFKPYIDILEKVI